MPTSTITLTTSFSREHKLPKCSLPSIGVLLGFVDAAPNHSAQREHLRSPDTLVQQSTSYSPAPPLRPGYGFHSSTPSCKAKTAPFSQQPSMTLPSPADHSSVSSLDSSIHNSAPYASPAPSVASYSSPIDPPSAASTMYYSRPASSATYQGTAPPPQQSAVTTAASSAIPAPSHQQIISPVTPSSYTPYQQDHGRYICRACHKAFDRPSGLRTHYYIHTGEKPFRCTHDGCRKAFSVNSNLKRHQRGFHRLSRR
ncbi:Zinc finger and SCAN domain-containing protein 5B [Aspergillus nanangensis]|uniref:Zinc finger and SCAN domain-containing protein 5B n=1 Tax=Aspergillus nanangensis TaxID=2582783 RepID=A0AAD4GN14_ASPNN|nr:Zinc finger and SCAN domain-containing protein 5B [Aspergillus nanangensis]